MNAAVDAPIRQCERCRLFAPIHDFARPDALAAWRSCVECRDLVFPRPEPAPNDLDAI
jgi:hypothetical protein